MEKIKLNSHKKLIEIFWKRSQKLETWLKFEKINFGLKLYFLQMVFKVDFEQYHLANSEKLLKNFLHFLSNWSKMSKFTEKKTFVIYSTTNFKSALGKIYVNSDLKMKNTDKSKLFL